MTMSRKLDLLKRLQEEEESEVVALLEYHGGLRSDLEALRHQVAEKGSDDDARYAELIERLDDMKVEAVAARKSSSEFRTKVIDWIDEKLVELARRMDADAGERQPPARAEVLPLGPAAKVAGTLDRKALRPAGTVNGHASDEANTAVAAVN